MPNYRLVIREQDRHVFDEIVDGRKSIETRAATGKYAGVKTGDTLVFTCGTATVTKTVVSAAHYNDLDDLYNHLSLGKILPSARSVEEAKQIHLSFPGYKQKLKTHGIVAFELE
jgi:ASC-1-like (ASCH) protein